MRESLTGIAGVAMVLAWSVVFALPLLPLLRRVLARCGEARRTNPLRFALALAGICLCIAYGGTKSDPVTPDPTPVPEPEPAPTHAITYDLDGGVNYPDNPDSYQEGGLEIVLGDPTREGYVFMGWEPAGVIPRGSTSDFTFTALWRTQEVWTVNFRLSGGNLLRQEAYPEGTSVSVFPKPAANGLRFVGWYRDGLADAGLNPSNRAGEAGWLGSYDAGTNRTLTVYPAYELPVREDGRTYVVGGDSGLWTVQTNVVAVGSTALLSAPIRNTGFTWIQTTVTGGGLLSFDWKTSCATGCDVGLTFELDGEVRDFVNGAFRGWMEQKYALEGGKTASHDLLWTFRKGTNVVEGLDCAWLDAVAVKPGVTVRATFDYNDGTSRRETRTYQVGRTFGAYTETQLSLLDGEAAEAWETLNAEKAEAEKTKKGDELKLWLAYDWSPRAKKLEESFAARRKAIEWPDPGDSVQGKDAVFVGWFTQPAGGVEVNVDDLAGVADMTCYAHWSADLDNLLNTPETLAAEKGLSFGTDATWEAAPADDVTARSAKLALEGARPAGVSLETEGVGVLSFLFRTSETNTTVRVLDVVSALDGSYVETNLVTVVSNGVVVSADVPVFTERQLEPTEREVVCDLEPITAWQQVEVPLPGLAAAAVERVVSTNTMTIRTSWYGSSTEVQTNRTASFTSVERMPRHKLVISVSNDWSAVVQLADVRWTQVTETAVTFDANGGTLDGRTEEVLTYSTAGRFGSLPEPERAGYAFVGWYASTDGGQVGAEDWVPVVPCTYRAQWTTRIANVADLPGATFRTGGDGYWFGQTAVSHDGQGAARTEDLSGNGSTWFETVLDGDSFLSFWWLLDSDACWRSRLTVSVDGDSVGSAETDWSRFYYYLTDGRHRVKWTYAQHDCGNSATGYVDQVSVVRNGTQDSLPAWAEKVQHYGVWITDNLPALAQMYRNRFEADAADYEARILHAAATLLQLGEDSQLVALLAKFGYTPVYAPLGFNGAVDLSAAPKANAVVDQVAAKSVAALQTALADLEAVPAAWTGSIVLDPEVYPVDAEARVDIADVLVLKAAVQHALATVAYVQGLDLSVDYDALLEEIEDQLVPEVSELPAFGAGEAAWSRIPVQNWKSHKIGRNAELDWVKCARVGDTVHLVARMSDACPSVPDAFSPGFKVGQKVGGGRKAKFHVMNRREWGSPVFSSGEGRVRNWANNVVVHDDDDELGWGTSDDGDADQATMTALTYWKGRLLEMRIQLAATMDPATLCLRDIWYGFDVPDTVSLDDGLVPAADIVVDGSDDDWVGVPHARWSEACECAEPDVPDAGGSDCGWDTPTPAQKTVTAGVDTAWMARSDSALHAAVRVGEPLDGYEVAEATFTYRTKLHGTERDNEDDWNEQSVAWQPLYDRDGGDDRFSAAIVDDFVELSCAFPDAEMEADDEDRLDANDVKFVRLDLRLVNVDGGEIALVVEPAPAADGKSWDWDERLERARFRKARNVLSILDDHPGFLSATRSTAKLGEAKTWLKKSVQTLLAADTACDRRTDGRMHLFDYDPAESAKRRKVREGLQDVLASLDRAVTVDMDARLDGLEAAGVVSASRAAKIRTDAAWGEGGSATVYLGSLFGRAPSRALLPQFLLEYVPYFDTLPDPTFGGLVPDLTLDALWTALDGRLGTVAKNFTGASWPTPVPKKRRNVDLWMVKSVTGGGVLTYVADLEHAVEGSALECYVDDVLQPTPVFAGTKATLAIDLGRSGDHDIVWHFKSADAQMFDVYPVRDIRGAAALADRVVTGSKGSGGGRPSYATDFGAFDRLWETVEPNGQGGYLTTGGHEQPFDASTAETFDGVVVDAQGFDVGTIQVKTTKATARKAASLKANVTLLGRKRIAFKGTLNADGTSELAAKGVADNLVLTLGANGLNGTWGSYVIVGARNPFASRRPHAEANADLSRWAGVYTVALATRSATGAGAAFAGGTSVLSLTVGAKGRVRIAGTMADGAKVSATSQLLVGDSFCMVPVVVPLYSKKGGVAFSVGLSANADPAVYALSTWDASASKTPFTATLDPEAVVARLAASLPSALTVSLPSVPELPGGASVFTQALPAGMSVAQSGGRFTLPRATKVALNGSALEGADGENPSGLKLSLTAKSGVFKGSFSVYALEAGKLKKVAATVVGGMVGRAGYGSVTVKNVGSWPFVLK